MRSAWVALVLIGCGSKEAAKPAPKKSGSDSVEIIDHAVPIDGGAVAGSEVEPNDTDETGTRLTVGATMRGRLDTDADVDNYAIDVANAGVLALDVTAVEGFDLSVELQDSAGTSVAKSDRPGVKVREGMPNFPVSAGRYTAIVRAKKPTPPAQKPAPKPKKGQPAPPPPPPLPSPYPSPIYEITASVAPVATGFEREPDDDRGAAIDLIIGDTQQGYVGWTGDADTWKVSLEALSAKNAIDIEVVSPESIALVVDLADGSGGAILQRKAPRGANVVVRGLVPVIGQGAAPFHFLTVKADRSNNETPYRVKVTEHVVGPDAEVEPDDSPEKAMAMPADRTTVKANWSSGDVDCFVLETTDAVRKFAITVDTPNEVDLALEVLVDGKSVGKSDVKGKGAAEKLEIEVPAKGRPVIRVKSSDPNAAGEGDYGLSVIEAP